MFDVAGAVVIVVETENVGGISIRHHGKVGKVVTLGD